MYTVITYIRNILAFSALNENERFSRSSILVLERSSLFSWYKITPADKSIVQIMGIARFASLRKFVRIANCRRTRAI